jgi:oligosaccharide amylase
MGLLKVQGIRSLILNSFSLIHMSKSIMLGNGSLLIGLDYYGQLKDFYFHYAGLENHVGHNLVHKIGINIEDQFSWLDDGSWGIHIGCEKDTMASSITAERKDLGIQILFSDVVYNEKNIFLREITVKNTYDRKRKIKLFFNQQFNISGSHTGDTGYYDPTDNSIIHYKGRRVFLIDARDERNGIDEYSIGLLGIEGKVGTYKDAEDGKLSKNPIEHGQVDSVFSMKLDIDSKNEKTMHYWIIAAKSIAKAKEINQEILIRGAEDLIHTTKNYWKAWVNLQEVPSAGLSEKLPDLFKKSLLYIRTHVNENGGIIASGDSDMLQFGRDYYEYVWPRDGAYTAIALMKAHDFNATRRFFLFCNDVITDKGYFMHKYRPDKSLGSSWHPWTIDGSPQLPIQEDETAIVLVALWEYFELTHDLEFIESIYNSLIKKAAIFLINYRDEKTGLPRASYDLWEMYYGISTYTASSVYGALIAASSFAKLLGKVDHAKEYEDAAETIKKGILKYLYDEKTNVFVKYLQTGKKTYTDNALDISSIYGVFAFGVLPAGDTRLKKAFDIYIDRLTVKTEVGGIARFEGDIYNHVGGDYPGNPWIVTTMWVCQYLIETAKTSKDLDEVKHWFDWVAAHTNEAGILPEQLHPFTGNHLSATPLVWSHAEFITTMILYSEKLKEVSI